MFLKFLVAVGLGIRHNQLDFETNLHSDLDPEILFRLHLFTVHKIALLYYCSLDGSTIMSVSILCTSLTLQTKIYSLEEIRTM